MKSKNRETEYVFVCDDDTEARLDSEVVYDCAIGEGVELGQLDDADVYRVVGVVFWSARYDTGNARQHMDRVSLLVDISDFNTIREPIDVPLWMVTEPLVAESAASLLESIVRQSADSHAAIVRTVTYMVRCAGYAPERILEYLERPWNYTEESDAAIAQLVLERSGLVEANSVVVE